MVRKWFPGQRWRCGSLILLISTETVALDRNPPVSGLERQAPRLLTALPLRLDAEFWVEHRHHSAPLCSPSPVAFPGSPSLCSGPLAPEGHVSSPDGVPDGHTPAAGLPAASQHPPGPAGVHAQLRGLLVFLPPSVYTRSRECARENVHALSACFHVCVGVFVRARVCCFWCISAMRIGRS